MADLDVSGRIHTELERVPGGYRVKTEAGWHLDVRPLLRLFRLIEVSGERAIYTGRFWCYSSFEAAVLAAAVWEVSADTSPVGWLKSGGARPR